MSVFRCSVWTHKACEEARGGALVVMLLPARTDSAWFHDHVLDKAELRFFRGRLRFAGHKGNAPHPHILAIYRPSL